MIPCKECLQRCYPSDPRIDGGCKYWCDKPEYYRQLEAQSVPPEQVIVHQHINYNSDVSKKQWHRIDAISGEVKYLREKLDQILEKRKARGKY